jgi:O-glycosyl hydrolase
LKASQVAWKFRELLRAKPEWFVLEVGGMARRVLAAIGVLGLVASLGAVSGGLASPAWAQVPEVVHASDFEDGTTQGWFRRGTAVLEASDAQANTGTFSLLTTGRTAGWHGPAFDGLGFLQPRGVYRFDAHVRLLEGDPTAPIQLTMQFIPESTGQTNWTQIASAPAVTDQAWVALSGEWSPPESGFEMQFYLESADPTVSYYMDDVTVTLVEPPPDTELPPEETGSVDFGTDLQHIDGFGFAQAFQRAAAMNGLFGLTEEHQQEVLDLLLNPETGAGFSILRLGIGSSADDPYDLMKSIQPQDPGGPDAEPQYEWDGYDGGQVWLARHAQQYGVERFVADAWSAPGYMKTNGDDANGGVLCGLPGTDCGEDWRQAYANYLLQYVSFYADEGIEITDLGFTNEPDLTTSYASMRFDGEQAVDFINVIGPTIAASNPDLNLVCCDAAGWNEQAGYTEAIEADPQTAQWVDVHTGHSYVSRARGPLPTEAPAWMSEYALPSGTWVEAWDGGPSSGLALANDIHDTLTLAEVNAYISWFGASLGGTAAPIQLDGPDYHVSTRLLATAAYSRFIRPDAFRVPAETTGQLMKISAFRNADGSKVVNILNNRESEVSLDLALAAGLPAATHLVTYRTDEEHSLARVGESTLTGPQATVDLPPRSLTTLVLEDCTTAVTGTHVGRLTVSSGATCLADGARVVGPVSVSAGAGLVATGATVLGPVTATNATTLRLVDIVAGSVSVSGVTDLVRISGSRITGPVTVDGADTGFAPVVVSGNTVRGPLSCDGNTPAPVNEGIPNTTTGPTMGQCRGL